MAVAGAGPYSAGSIFVQVVPSFSNFQNSIRDQVKDLQKVLGKDMEKQYREAGRQAGRSVGTELKDEVGKSAKGLAKPLAKEIRDETFTALRNVSRTLGKQDDTWKDLRKTIEGHLKDIAINPDIDVTEMRRKLDSVTKDLARNATLFGDTQMGVTAGRAYEVAAKARKLTEAASVEKISAHDIDLDPVSQSMRRALERGMEEAGNSPAFAKLKRQMDELDKAIVMRVIGLDEARDELHDIELQARRMTRLNKKDMERPAKIAESATGRGISTIISGSIREIDKFNPAEKIGKFGRLGDALVGWGSKMETAARHAKIMGRSFDDAGEKSRSFGNKIQMATLKAAVFARGGKTVRVAVTGLGKALGGVAKDGERTGNVLQRLRGKIDDLGFRTSGADMAFRNMGAAVFAFIPLLPVMASGIMGVSYALGAIAPMAAVAAGSIATLGIGFSGIMGGLKALQSQRDSVPMDNNKAQKNAIKERIADLKKKVAEEKKAGAASEKVAKAEDKTAKVAADNAKRLAKAQKSAIEDVKRARESAAKDNEAAVKREVSAQKKVVDAIKSVRDAEDRLRKAREDAKNKGKDISHDIKANKLAESQGVVDLFEATTAYNATMSDGSSSNLDKEKARISLENARLSLEDIRAEGKKLADAQNEWNKSGIDGTDDVKSAKEGVTSAVEDQKSAEADAAEAAKETAQTRIDSENSVRDAILAAEEQVRQVKEDNAERIQQAREDYLSAVSKTGPGDEPASQSALDAAQEELANFDTLSAPAAKVQTEFDKMGAAGQRFVLFLDSLRPKFRDFRDDIQTILLPSAEKAITTLMNSDAASAAANSIRALAGGLGELMEDLANSIAKVNGPWEKFFAMLGTDGVKIQDNFGQGLIYFFEALASVITALAPSAVDLSGSFKDLMKHFADWAASPKGQQEILDFMREAKDSFTKVAKGIWETGVAIIKLSKALAPYGSMVIDGLIWLFNLDPALLKAIAIGILAVVAGMAAMWVVANWQIVVFAILIGFLAWLYEKSPTFRKIIDEIVDVLKSLWDLLKKVVSVVKDFINVIKDAGGWLIRMFEKLFGAEDKAIGQANVWAEQTSGAMGQVGVSASLLSDVHGQAFAKIQQSADAMNENNTQNMDGVMGKWSDVQNAAKGLSDGVGSDFGDMGDSTEEFADRNGESSDRAMGKMSEMSDRAKSLAGAFGGYASQMGSAAERMAQRTTGAISHIQSAFNQLQTKTLPALSQAFDNATSSIATKFVNLRNAIASPLKNVLDGVINGGLLKGFNELAGQMNAKKATNVTVPKSLNPIVGGGRNIEKNYTGGVLKGYTPGRDVYKFISPDGGELHLSGGEAIMRPEWTAAVGGPAAVERMNAAARRSGIKGVRAAMSARQAFASGGVFNGDPLANIDRVISAGPQGDGGFGGAAEWGMSQLGHMGWFRRCLAFVNAAWGHSVARLGMATARQSMNAGPRVMGAPPRGAAAYYNTNGYAGHVALSLGDGTVLSNDIVTPGRIDRVPYNIFASRWGAPYMGYFDPKGQGPASGSLASIVDGIAGAIGSTPAALAFASNPTKRVAEWAGAQPSRDPFLYDVRGGVVERAIAAVASEGKDRFSLRNAVAEIPQIGQGLSSIVGKVTGVAQWTSTASSALKAAGLPLTYLPLLMHRIGVESGGNPRAINNWDSNARAGHPSQGLMQTIPETFNRYAGPYRDKGITDPFANIYAAIQYTKSRYGMDGIYKAWGGRKGYANGGVLDLPATGQPYNGTVLRDNGGPLRPGMTSVLNLTGETEHVYTARQHMAAQAALNNRRESGGKITQNLNVTGLDSMQAVDTMSREMLWGIRKVSREGRYGMEG